MSEENKVETGAGQVNMPGSVWGAAVDVAVCDRCHWVFVVERGNNPQRCPNCAQGSLKVAPLEQSDWADYARTPECYLQHREPVKMVNEAVAVFAKGLWFPPADLTPENLIKRVKRVFLPAWLLDSHVEAAWKAEMGFDYQVVSHQDYYDDDRSGWESREVRETRIRWEPRLGRLERAYVNISAPALEENQKIVRRIGPFQLEDIRPYSPEVLDGAFVRLPDRPIDDAWPEAAEALMRAAAEECCQAAGAEHVRGFQWTPAFSRQNWTLLLLPVSLTYYLDDDGNPQQLILHGQTGRLSGRRKASMVRAQKVALWVLAAAALTFLLSLGMMVIGMLLPPLLVVGGLGMVLSLLLALAAIAPPAIAWNINRKLSEGGNG